MRKSREEAIQTRKRIVSTAAAEIRRNGIVASGLNELMAAAGLTRGGFYKHFESKNQLVAEALAEAAKQVIVERIGTAASRGKSPAAEYLSAAHRDHSDWGCPLAAIGAELGRCDEQVRSIATESFLQLVNSLAAQHGKANPTAARRRAIVAASTLVGALTMSRIVNDPKLSSEILKEAQKSVAE
jgi:TetR/AcrR family transcriptional regulator, transcriptional repressor for nem operon